VFFEQATEFERAKVDVPDTVIDLLKPHVFSGAHDRTRRRRKSSRRT